MRLEKWLGPDKYVNCPIKEFLLYICRYHAIDLQAERMVQYVNVAEVTAYGFM